MAKRKGQHKSDKEQYAAYSAKSSREVNRKRKLAKHLKNHPNDAQAASAVGKPKAHRVKSHVKGHYPKAKDVVLDRSGKSKPMPSFEPNQRNPK